MPTYNSNALVNDWSTAIAANPELAEKAWAKRLHLDALTQDDLAAFESDEIIAGTQAAMSPNSPRGIIVRKNDFTKLGGDTMVFQVMGPPAGPGVQGEAELTGRTSRPTFDTYSCKVEVKRDAVEYTKKQLQRLASKDSILPASQQFMSQKAGLRRQREMMLTLRRYASGNIYRPNGRLSRNTLEYADTLDPTAATYAKARATMNGATPLMNLKTRFGTVSEGYLCFATEEALFGVRNHTGYQNALQHAGERGDANPLFTGRLVPYQNVHYFNHKIVNPGWDDVIGSPLTPRARLRTAFGVDSSAANCKLTGGNGAGANTTCLFFQDFLGYDYLFTELQAASADATEHYAWIINPDGSVGFVAYTGSGNNGNEIVLTKVLTPDGAGTSTKGAATVGNIVCTNDTWDSVPAAGGASGANTSANHRYTDTFVAGAAIIQANANGVPIAWSLLFGASAAVRGYGQQEVQIKQERDYSFVKGMGYEGVWGQALCERSDGLTNGYTLMEHAYHPEGFDLPAVA